MFLLLNELEKYFSFNCPKHSIKITYKPLFSRHVVMADNFARKHRFLLWKSLAFFRNVYFLHSLLYEVNIKNSLNTGLVFTPEVFILCTKKYRRLEGWVYEFWNIFTLANFINEIKLLHYSFCQHDFGSMLNKKMKPCQ